MRGRARLVAVALLGAAVAAAGALARGAHDADAYASPISSPTAVSVHVRTTRGS